MRGEPVPVPINSTNKVFCCQVKNLKFNFSLHKKPIDLLVWW